VEDNLGGSVILKDLQVRGQVVRHNIWRL